MPEFNLPMRIDFDTARFRPSRVKKLATLSSTFSLHEFGIISCLLIFVSGYVHATEAESHCNYDTYAYDRHLTLSKTDLGRVGSVIAELKRMDVNSGYCSKLRQIVFITNECSSIARLRGGGETSRLSRSTPKTERSAKKRRHRTAFYHSDRGSDEEVDSSMRSERTFRQGICRQLHS